MSALAEGRPAVEPPPGGGLRGGQLIVLAILLGLAAVAWLGTGLRMTGMDAGPGTDPGAFGFYISTWVVMMAAMMFPSIGPMVLAYRNLASGRSSGTGLFVGAYLAVWTASGLIAYGALKGGRSVAGSWLGWHHAGRWVAVAVLAGAALYEFTPWKHACLVRCRSPHGFLITRWRQGRAGAFRMGVEHGVWCLGCCWSLMVVLFALGAMSITWMIVVTVLIAVEKLMPRRRPGIALVSVVLGVLAIGVAAAPADVPGLTIPGSPAAMRAMRSMRSSMGPDAPAAEPMKPMR